MSAMGGTRKMLDWAVRGEFDSAELLGGSEDYPLLPLVRCSRRVNGEQAPYMRLP